MTKILFRVGLDENIKNVVKITENQNAVFLNKMMLCFRDKIRKHFKKILLSIREIPKLVSANLRIFSPLSIFSRSVSKV
jgi:hypothetical protein